MTKNTKPILAWWFAADDRLPNGDGRKVVIGQSHHVEPPIIPCKRGLHASASVLDALQYAPGGILYRVELSGIIVKDDDKFAASDRKYLARIDAEPVLRLFARQCALDVLHLWEAPEIVQRYLKTGDETIRAAARDAAQNAAWDAAWTAARGAARAAAQDAAWDAAWAAAWAAARAAAWAAARGAAWDAARDAAWEKQRTRLEALALEAIKAP